MTYERLPHRQESRYMLDEAQTSSVNDRFDLCFERVDYPDPVTSTAHLAGQELDHPPLYARLRNYGSTLHTDVLPLDLEEEWFFELKKLSGTKVRIRQPLGHILLGLSYPEHPAFLDSFPDAHEVLQTFGKPLMPIIATQSLRNHYTAPGARITVDEQVSYYGLRWGELCAHRFGSRQMTKVELKLEEPSIGNTTAEQFTEICQQLGGSPAADGEVARDMLAAYLRFMRSE